MTRWYLVLAAVLAGCAGGELGVLSDDAGDGPTVDLARRADLGSGPDLASRPDLTTLPDLSPPPPDLAKPTKVTLPFSWEGEQFYYYCGPSATYMALSVHLQNPPSQQTIGAYMGTTTNGTDDISLVKGALDHYLNVNTYAVTYLATDPPSQAQQDALKKALVESIDAGNALVVNVVSGWRPPGYPSSGTIYHYIAVVGYDQSGDLALIADPAATGCGSGYCNDPNAEFGKVPKSYWIQTHDLGVWITPKGYTYTP